MIKTYRTLINQIIYYLTAWGGFEINNETKDSKTSRKGLTTFLFFAIGCIFLTFGYTTLAVPIKIPFEILIGLIVSGYILMIIYFVYMTKYKIFKNYFEMGGNSGVFGAYLIFIYFQVSRIEGYNDNNRINKFYFDNTGIIKSTILLPAFVFILIGAILIFYYLRKKSREVKFSI